MIYVRNITYGFYGKHDHFFGVDKNETFFTMIEKIRTHFRLPFQSKIEMFDDKTEQLIENDEEFQTILRTPFASITFCGKDAKDEKKKAKKTNIL